MNSHSADRHIAWLMLLRRHRCQSECRKTTPFEMATDSAVSTETQEQINIPLMTNAFSALHT